MSRFETLDAAIVKAITDHENQFGGIYYRVVHIADVLAVPDRFGDRNVSRVVDRRLQALRKAGKIAFAKGRWTVVA